METEIWTGKQERETGMRDGDLHQEFCGIQATGTYWSSWSSEVVSGVHQPGINVVSKERIWDCSFFRAGLDWRQEKSGYCIPLASEPTWLLILLAGGSCQSAPNPWKLELGPSRTGEKGARLWTSRADFCVDLRGTLSRMKLDTGIRLNCWPQGKPLVSVGSREHKAECWTVRGQACVQLNGSLCGLRHAQNFPWATKPHRLPQELKEGGWNLLLPSSVCASMWACICDLRKDTQTASVITFNYTSTRPVNGLFNAGLLHTQKDWHAQLNIAYLCSPEIY